MAPTFAIRKPAVAVFTLTDYVAAGIMTAAQAAWLGLVDEFSAADADFKAIYTEWDAFRKSIYNWNKTNEFAFTSWVYNV